MLLAKQEKFRDAFNICVKEMNDITTAKELAMLAYTRWFKEQKGQVLTELCISLLKADKLEEGKGLMREEC
jgi:hypothetical protein